MRHTLYVTAVASAALVAATGERCLVHAQTEVTRVSVTVKQTLDVRVPGIQSLIVTDPSRAEVAQTATGFRVVAKRAGDTIVQAFTAEGMRVYIVAIAMPTPAPAAGPTPSAAADFGRHRRIDSAWGVNRYTGELEYRAGRLTAQHDLDLAGVVAKGEYRATLDWVQRGLEVGELDHVHAAWTNAAKTQDYELGDIAAPVLGTSLLTALPVFGVRARERNQLDYTELSGGVLRVSGGRRLTLDAPIAGASVGMTRALPWLGGTDVDLAGAAHAYVVRGRPGAIAGLGVKASWHQQTAVEAKVASSAKRPGDGAAGDGVSGSLAASHAREAASYSASIEANTGDFVQPVLDALVPAGYRVSAGAARAFADRSWRLGANVTHHGSRPDDAWRRETTAAARVAAASSPATHLALDHRETWYANPERGEPSELTLSATPGADAGDGARTAAVPAGGAGGGPGGLSEVAAASLASERRHRRHTQATVHSKLGATGQLGAQLEYQVNRFANRTITSYSAAANVARAHGDRFTGSLGASLAATDITVLGEDLPRLAIQSNLAATGSFLDGPFQYTAAANVVQLLAPTASTGVNVAVGVQFTPTTADRVGLRLYAARGVGATATTWGATLGVTHYFGNGVDSKPLLRVLTEGEIEGAICVDANGDGECGADEAPLADVKVSLSDGATTRSDRRGRYRFGDVKPGTYTLEVDEGALRAYGRPTTASRLPVALPANGRVERSFGVRGGCDITGHVLNDLDMDGTKSPGDPLIPAATIRIEGEGASYEATTDGLGAFVAHVATCGRYKVTLDPGSLAASMRPLVDETEVELGARGERAAVHLMAFGLRTVQGVVFVDANANGVRDPGEAPVAGAQLRWRGGAGESDTDGSYLLRRLPAGTTELELVPDSLTPGLVPASTIEVRFDRDPGFVDLDVPVLSIAP
jgi:hypothetical protein